MIHTLQKRIGQSLLDQFSQLKFTYFKIDAESSTYKSEDFYIILGNEAGDKFRILIKQAMLPEEPPIITTIEESMMLEEPKNSVITCCVAYVQFDKSYNELPRVIVKQVS